MKLSQTHHQTEPFRNNLAWYAQDVSPLRDNSFNTAWVTKRSKSWTSRIRSFLMCIWKTFRSNIRDPCRTRLTARTTCTISMSEGETHCAKSTTSKKQGTNKNTISSSVGEEPRSFMISKRSTLPQSTKANLLLSI